MLSESHVRLLEKELDRAHELLASSQPGSDDYNLAAEALERLHLALVPGVTDEQLLLPALGDTGDVQ